MSQPLINAQEDANDAGLIKPVATRMSRAREKHRSALSRLLRGGRLTRYGGKVVSCAPDRLDLFSIPSPAVFATALVATMFSASAMAANVYWDTNGTAVGIGGASGTWDTTTPLWTQASDGVSGPYVPWNNANNDTAVFSGTAGTVTIGEPIVAGGINFTVTGYTLSGANTLTLAGSQPTITVAGLATISASMAGTNGLTKAGGGTLTLNGGNTFSGGVNIGAGGLTVATDADLGAASNTITMAQGTTLTANAALAAGRVVTLTDVGQVNLAGAGVGSAKFTGAGGINLVGGVTMSNLTSDFTGVVRNVDTGLISFKSIANLGAASSLGAPVDATNGTITMNAGGTATTVFNYVGTGDTSNRILNLNSGSSGVAQLRNSGTGTLTMTGNIVAGGPATVSFDASSADLALAGAISSTAATSIQFTDGGAAPHNITLGDANTYSGLTTINNVNVVASTLANTNTASSFGTGASNNTIALSSGTLTYTGAGATTDRTFTNSISGTINNNGTGALTLTGPVTFVAGGGADSLTLGGSYAGVNTLSGVISNPGSLIVNGGAGDAWLLSGNNTFTGATTVDSGTLQIANSNALGGAPGALTVNGGGEVDLNGVPITVSSLASTSAGGDIELNGADLTVKGSTSTAYAGGLNGTGGLTKSGTGTLTLSAVSGYSGATTINGGVLALNFDGVSAPPNGLISNASTLKMAGGTLAVTGGAGDVDTQIFAGTTISAGSNTIGATSGAGGSASIDLGAITHTGGLVNFALPTSGSISTSSTTLGGWATVNGTDYAQVTGGIITALTNYATKDDASTWVTGDVVSDTAGNPNTPFTNTTAAGTVQLGGLKYTAAAGSTVNIGGLLGVDGTIIVAPSVGNTNQLLTGGQLTGPAGGGTVGVLQNGGGTFQIASTIVDNGGTTGFTKAGTGLVALTGPNTYTGGTTISGGTLKVNTIADGGQASAIGQSNNDPSNLALESGTLEYSGATTSSDRGITLVNGGPSRTIQVDDVNANLTFSGKVTSTDDSDLTKTGGGTLTLANGANDYVGRTVIGGGTLSVNTLANGGLPSGIGASSSDPTNLVLQGGGTLNYTGADASTDRSITLTNGGIGVASAATTLTDSGTIIGPGGLTKTGAGTLVLSGTNTYTGGTEVAAGTLRAGSNQAFGPPHTTTVDAGATLDLNNFDTSLGSINGPGNVLLGSAILTTSSNGSFSGTISGTGGLLVAGGTQTMSGCHNSYSGGTTIRGGVVSTDCLANGGQPSGIGASGPASANLNIQAGGTLTYTGTDVTTDRGILLGNGNGGVNVASATTTVHITGQITGATGALVKSGSGVLVLDNGTNDYVRGTQINAGTLRVGVAGAVPNRGVAFLNVAGATLDLNNNNTTIQNLSGGGTAGGNVTLGSGTLTISDGSNTTFGGTISGTGGVVKSGGSLETFTSSGSSYTGSTTISGGELLTQFLGNGGANSSIGASSSAAANLVLGGGALGYIGTGGSTDRQFTLSNAGGAIDAAGAGAINFTSTAPIAFTGAGAHALTLRGTNTANNTLAAQISDSNGAATSLNKTGTGTWVVSNTNNTYSGVTSITGGVLAVTKLANGGAASSIGQSSNAASNLVIGNNSTLRYTGTGDTTDRQFSLAQGTTFIESSGAGALNFANTGNVTLQGTNAAHTIALGGTNTGNNTMGGTIADDGTGQTILAKNDSGTWILTGNNTYTGNTVVNNGTLIVGNGGTNGNAGAGNVIVANAASTLGVNRSDTFNFNGTLSGPGAFEQRGSGTTVLTAAGSSIGAARISGGTLQVNGTLASSTLAMSNTSALTVNGTVDNTGNPLALTGDGGNSTITVNGGGTLSANGNLGAGSDTLVVAGTLNTGASKLSLGDGDDNATIVDSTVLTGAGIDGGAGTDTLTVDNAAAKTLDGALLANFEDLTKQGAGTLTLTGNHAYTTTTISAGTLQIGNGGATGSLTGNIVDNSVLAINRSGNYTLAGTISGTGDVNQIGSGTITLTGANSYKGATNVQAGTLLVNGDQSGATGATTVGTGATLGGTGTLGGDVSVNDGAHLSPGTLGGEAGTLAIGGNLVLSANSNMDVNFGQANVAGGPLNDLVNVTGNVALGGTLNVTQTNGGTFGPGAYRVINYDGTLTGGTMTVAPAAGLALQTSVNHQVNLLNTGGVSLTFWDGDAGPQNNSAVDGGNGTWRANGDNNWTGSDGVVNGGFDNGGFAVFEGTGGNVGVDVTNGAVQASGMQFASNGYSVSGDPIALTGPQSIIRVGDGTAPGAAYTATIASDLSGASQLVKTDLGTLVLGGTNTYTGGTQVNGGTLSISSDNNLGDAAGDLTLNGGTLLTTASLTSARHVGLSADSTVSVDGATTTTLAGVVDGTGMLTKTGAGTLALAGDATQGGGTTIAAGTLQIGTGGTSGTLAGDVTDNGTLVFNRSDLLQFGGVISGTGAVEQMGATGGTVLTADNSYTGGTTISGGMLQLGNGGTSGMVAGDITNNGELGINRSDNVTFDGIISGTGTLSKAGGGTLTLTADNSYTGTTSVSDGTLLINGDQTAATGNTTVSGTLGGTGTVGGDVAIQGGAQLSPGAATNTPGVFNIKGGLTLAPTSTVAVDFGQAGVVGGAFNDLVNVTGNVTLGGTIDVRQSAGGTFGPGVYRVISYGGTLTKNPVATTAANTFVQTSVDKQVNLVNTAGLTLRYWDGDAGGRNDSVISGGDGTWNGATGNDNWTTFDGTANAPFQTSSFAVFEAAPGAVTVDNTQGDVNVAGMQFAVDGYSVTQGTIGLDGPQTEIRVGDGTLAGAGYTATIGSTLTGASQLLKTDLGTLVLAGNNTYSGGTEIDAGKVSISSDANLGAASGGLAFNGGTLETTADLSMTRPVTMTGNGTFLTDAATTATVGGAISGAGVLTKDGAGTLVLAGDAAHTGGTTIAAGTLQVGAGGTTGSLAGDVTDNATLAFDRSDILTIGGVISGTGAVVQGGTGTTSLTAANTYTGGTTINAGTLQLGNGGTSGLIAGNVTDNGTLSFNRSDDVGFGGIVSGTGGVSQDGSGTTALTANNAYTGATTVNSGTLLVQGDQTAATGATTVNGGTLGGTGTVGGDVSVASGGTLAPGAATGTPGTLTIKGGLSLAAGSNLNVDFGQANTVGGALNDLVNVGGDLTLGGMVNVNTAAGGSFGPGVYRVISYSGNLLGGTLGLGTVPAGSNVSVQTSFANQVNLVDAASSSLSFWDGDAGGRNDSQVAGGNGTWRASGDDNWTTSAGDANGAFTAAGFAVFGGAPGTVTVTDSQGAVNPSGMQFAVDGYTVQGDAITLAGTDATIRVGDGTAAGAGYTATINAPLQGSAGVTKTDVGTLVLGGASSYTGPTTVAGGTLRVDGSIASSAVTVAGAATLAGSGTVGSTTINTGGTVAPGNSIGTLNVAGNYVQQSGAAYQADVDPGSTASDRIAVSGTATLEDGAVLNVTKTANAAYVPGTRYTVLTAAGGVNGTFTVTGNTALSSFIGLTGAQDANNAYLVIGQTRPIASVGNTRNETATGRGVDSLPIDNPLKLAVLNLGTDDAARAALNSLSGEIHASMQTASLQDSHFVRDAATDRLRDTFCSVGSQTDRRDANGNPVQAGSADCNADAHRPAGWVRVFGGWQHTDSNGNAAAMNDSTSGIFVGADAPVGQNMRVGVMAGYSHSNVDVGARDSSGSSDNYHLGVYGGGQWGALGLRTGAAYTWQNISTSRSVNFAGFSDSNGASYDAGMGQLFGDLGYRIDAGRFSYEPFANVAYVKLHTDSFTENGGAAALHSPGDDSDVTFGTLGLRASAAVDLGGTQGTLRGSLGWRHAFGDNTPMSTLQFQGGQQFGVAGVPIAQDAAVFDAGVDLNIAKNAVLGFSYGGQFAGSSNAQSIQATLKVSF